MMPTSTPPPPPPIEHSISLDERLDASAAQVEVPGNPGHTVSAGLAHVPSRMSILYGTGDESAPVLELKFEFLDEAKEARMRGEVAEAKGRYAVEMSVGKQTGRIYRMALKGVDPSNEESVRAVTEGIGACFHDYVESQQASLRQRAILHSMAALVAMLLPDLVARIRDSLGT